MIAADAADADVAAAMTARRAIGVPSEKLLLDPATTHKKAIGADDGGKSS